MHLNVLDVFKRFLFRLLLWWFFIRFYYNHVFVFQSDPQSMTSVSFYCLWSFKIIYIRKSNSPFFDKKKKRKPPIYLHVSTCLTREMYKRQRILKRSFWRLLKHISYVYHITFFIFRLFFLVIAVHSWAF